MTKQGDEHEEGDKEDNNENTKVENFPPQIWPAREVSNTFSLEDCWHLGHPWLDSEDGDAREGGKERDEPGGGKEFVRRGVKREGPGDGTVPVISDGHQHIIGGGQREGLHELKQEFIT